MRKLGIIIRGQVYGMNIHYQKLAQPKNQKSQYKYFVILQGDNSFSDHPTRSVAFINSKAPTFASVETQMRVDNHTFVFEGTKVSHGFIDCTFIVNLLTEDIRSADYIGVLSDTEINRIDKNLIRGLGLSTPSKMPVKTILN